MQFLQFTFPVSGVETFILIPPLVAFAISFFTSMGGISGAFLLLPFQMSVLGFTSPSVTSTNFLFNVTGTPGGVGAARTPPVFMDDGDLIEIEVNPIGTLSNPVVAES